MSLRQQLKRAFWEWGVLGAIGASGCCLLMWALYFTGAMKLAPHAADSPVLVGEWMCFPSEDGTISLSRQLESLEQVGRWRRLNQLGGAVDRHWQVPGLAFQYLAFPGRRPQWLLRCSMLIPAIVIAVMALVFGWKYRRIQKMIAASPALLPVEPEVWGQEFLKSI